MANKKKEKTTVEQKKVEAVVEQKTEVAVEPRKMVGMWEVISTEPIKPDVLTDSKSDVITGQAKEGVVHPQSPIQEETSPEPAVEVKFTETRQDGTRDIDNSQSEVAQDSPEPKEAVDPAEKISTVPAGFSQLKEPTKKAKEPVDKINYNNPYDKLAEKHGIEEPGYATVTGSGLPRTHKRG